MFLRSHITAYVAGTKIGWPALNWGALCVKKAYTDGGRAIANHGYLWACDCHGVGTKKYKLYFCIHDTFLDS